MIKNGICKTFYWQKPFYFLITKFLEPKQRNTNSEMEQLNFIEQNHKVLFLMLFLFPSPLLNMYMFTCFLWIKEMDLYLTSKGIKLTLNTELSMPNCKKWESPEWHKTRALHKPESHIIFRTNLEMLLRFGKGTPLKLGKVS